MNSELKIEELDVVSSGQTAGQALWNGLVNGFEGAGGEVSCSFHGTEKCNFSSGGNTVTVNSWVV